MDINERISLIKQVGEEIITEEDLKTLLETKQNPIAYDGFEPSGTSIHIAQGLLRAININKMTKTGCKFKILVADWHAWANNKMGGDLEKIQKVGKYLIEVWKACDMDTDNVEFVWVSDMVKDDAYWKIVMQIARETTLNRVLRTTQIMGRSENDVLQASQIFYPCMQAADIFYLKADICQLGMDQRKVNMLAREVAPKLGFEKPVIISHHMLMGLQEPLPKKPEIEKFVNIIKENPYPQENLFKKINYQELCNNIENPYPSLPNKIMSIASKFDNIYIKSKNNEITPEIKQLSKELKEDAYNLLKSYIDQRQMRLKMSKSKPDTAIFMSDSADDVKRKISKAYCPEKQVEENPMMEYCKYILFEKFNKLIVERPEKFGGNIELNSYNELVDVYSQGKLHPMDLKTMVTKYLNELLEPVRKKLGSNEVAQKLYEEIKKFEVTR